MRRNPIYTFKDLSSTGIEKVPIGSTVQILDVEEYSDIIHPMQIQITGNYRVFSGMTVANFLLLTDNYTDSSEIASLYSELSKIEVQDIKGWRLLGENPNNHVPIGQRAIDLTIVDQDTNPKEYGASGIASFTTGYNTTAAGNYSSAWGYNTKAINRGEVVFGMYNELKQDSILQVGIGREGALKNALEVYSTGAILAPNLEDTIETSGDYSLVNKAYLDKRLSVKFDKVGGSINGSVDIAQDLNVQGDAYFSNIKTKVEFAEDTIFYGDITASNILLDDLEVEKNITMIGEGKLRFTSTDIGPIVPAIYWNRTLDQIQISTDSLVDQEIWHTGNLDPDNYVKHHGDTVYGDYDVQGELTVNNHKVLTEEPIITRMALIDEFERQGLIWGNDQTFFIRTIPVPGVIQKALIIYYFANGVTTRVAAIQYATFYMGLLSIVTD